MGKLIEEKSLRDKRYIFDDRNEAGCLLADTLIQYKGSNGIVLAIPAGGVPVAAKIACALDLPMDLLIVRKLQIPFNPEAGFGAMGPDGGIIVNEPLVDQLRLTKDIIQASAQKTLEVIRQRDQIFRSGKPYPSLRNKTVILVDDGLASGFTMLAALRFVKEMMPKKIIVAVPTASRNTVEFMLPQVDELVCLNVRSGFYFAVAEAYRNWYDLGDEEVISLIKTFS